MRGAFVVLALTNAALLSAATGVFEANRGQAPPEVRFIARDSDRAVWLLSGPELVAGSARIRFGRLPAKPVGRDPLQGRGNYFLGSHADRWLTNIPTFGRVEYSNVERGTAVRLYYERQRLEFEFVLKRGADPGAVRLHFSPNVSASRSAGGDVVLKDPGGNVYMAGYSSSYDFPVVDAIHAFRTSLSAGGATSGTADGFVVRFDPGASSIQFSTAIGAVVPFGRPSIAVGADGSVYLCVSTNARDFPVVGAFQDHLNGLQNAAVLKIAP